MTATRTLPPLTYAEAKVITRARAGVWPDAMVSEANDVLDAALRRTARQIDTDDLAQPNHWTPANEQQMRADDARGPLPLGWLILAGFGAWIWFAAWLIGSVW